MKYLLFLVLLLAGCTPMPDDKYLQEIAKEDHAIILTDPQGNKYAATHYNGNLWWLRPVKIDK